MAKLLDAIKQDKPDYMRDDAHAMNVLSRLLFCLFAEDHHPFLLYLSWREISHLKWQQGSIHHLFRLLK